jgi:N-acyl-D-amino-acid deacylase
LSFDIILKHGTVYDGGGAQPVVTDVAIERDTIAAIGDMPDGRAGQILDCSGLVVTPGFIDIHAHSDITLLYNHKAESKIRQGVTTECTGQCGLGVFPVRPENRDALRNACSFIASAPVEWTWGSTAEYIAALRKAGPSLNVAPMVAQGPIRAEVVGLEATPATPQQTEQMCQVLQECFDEGAVGLSFGLAYAPGAVADAAEIEALCRVAAANNKHVSVHIRNEGPTLIKSLDEIIGIAHRMMETGLLLRLQIDHFKCSGPRNWHLADRAIEVVEQAKDEGLDIAFDVYPYDVASRHLTGSFPAWMHSGGNEMLLQRLADPAIREQLRREMAAYDAGETDHHPLEFTPDRIRIVDLNSQENQDVIGKFLSDVIAERGYDPIDVVCDLIIEERGHLNVALYTMNEEDVEKRLRHPLSMIGSDGFALATYGELSRGRPHPRSYGTFPRFLGQYVRDRGIMDMATAVNKCTARSASRLNISDRGLLKCGYKADVTVFDPHRIIDRATFENPHQYPDGIEHVIVNGELTVSGGEHTGAAAGLVLENN